MIRLKRLDENPILKPNKEQAWEAEAVFNGCPIKHKKHIYLLYRALSLPHYHATAQTRMLVSDIGIAVSDDGVSWRDRQRFIVPERSWEKFGCEDPRVTKFDDTYYIFYTALSEYPFTASGIKVAVAISEDLKSIKEKHLVTPFNAKAMTLFPQKIKGKMCALFTVNTDLPPAKIALAYFDTEKDMWSKRYWQEWYANLDQHTVPLQRKEEDHIEVGAPPIKTERGWLVIYSYIRNYSSSQRLFTIEAVLLDIDDPAKIIGRTDGPLLVPEEGYEKYGMVPNAIFPSGALVRGDELFVYYGAADTTCCLASVKLSLLVDSLSCRKEGVVQFKRAKGNPVILPIKEHSWEAKATFNPAAIYENEKVHIIYRAMSENNTSVFGYASSVDGVHIESRDAEPVYVPRESFEQKIKLGQNSGCEDPRITKIDDTLYMCYTAFDGSHPPRIALTSISLEKFLAKQWDWAKPVLISPAEFDNKDACIFPEKVKGKYLIFHRFGNDIDIALVSNLNFDGSTWLEERRWLLPRQGMWDSEKIGIVAPPVKTKSGWILLYHGVSEEDHHYRVGAVLLDLRDSTRVIGRTDDPLMEPETLYEKKGQVANVVFPCGNVVVGDQIFIYYGGGDSVIGVASIKIQDLIGVLLPESKKVVNIF